MADYLPVPECWDVRCLPNGGQVQAFDKRRGSDAKINARMLQIRGEIADARDDHDQMSRRWSMKPTIMNSQTALRVRWLHRIGSPEKSGRFT